MRLKTFGRTALEGATFSRPKGLLLLAYLAVEGRRSRAHLRELFWPGVADPASNLRFLLSQIRRAGPDFIREEGQHLHLALGSDVTELLQAFRSAPDRVPGLYQGAFLEGLTLDWTPELEDWVLTTREHLAGQVRTHLIRRAGELHHQGQWEEVSALLRQAWRLPGARPLDAEELQSLYALALASGDELAGPLRQEARELDLPLGNITPQPPAQAAGPARADALPQPPTSFVGREEELRELRALLDEPDIRLLTLLGPGGIGKTRLALELARQRPGPPPCLVALETVVTPDLMLNAVALALGLKPSPTQSTLDLLKAGIGDQPLLLLLDNFESVRDAGPHLADLLEACPELQLLVTSRKRLGLPQETVYPLTGLSLAGGPESEAVRLFVGRARQANARFRLASENAPAVVSICQQVEGSPLGIELSAAWVRALTAPQIAEELAQGPELLEEGEGKGRRSLRGIFEQSWARLGPQEQGLASALSVFAGGFTRADAAAVTGATLRHLLTLVDAAFLSFSGRGRYTIHPLLRHFLSQKLAADAQEHAATEAAFVTHFADRADDAWTGYYMRGEQQTTAAWGQEEYVNLEAALASAERRGEPEQALRLAWFHADGWINRGLMREGAAQLGRLLAGVADRKGQAYRRGLLTRSQLRISMGEGGPDLAQALEEVIELSRQARDGVCLSQALRARGILCAYAGDLGAARDLMQEAVQAAEAAAFPYGQAAALINLGSVSNHLHDLAAAREYVGRGLQLAETHGFESLQGGGQILYAEALLNLGEYAAAEVACERGEPVLTRLHKQRDLGFIFLVRGIAALWKSGADAQDRHLHLDEAERWLSRSAELRERGAVGGQMDLLRPGVGDVLLARGATEEARTHFHRALNAAQEKRDTAATMNAHHGLARLAHLEGRFPAALEHFRQMLTLTGNFIALLVGLEAAAGTISRLGGHDVAVRAWGAADAFRRAHTLPVPPFFLVALNQEQTWTRARLGEAAYGRLFATGEHTEIQEALASLLAWEGEETVAALTSLG